MNDRSGLKQRSLSEELGVDQRRKYEKLIQKNIRHERSVLSRFRYNKMKNLIIQEVDRAIQEADIEPSMSVNNFESIIIQNEEDVLGLG